MSDVLNIILLISNSVAGMFLALDSIEFGDTGFTILHIFLAILFLELIIDYMLTILKPHITQDDDEKDIYPVSGYSETVLSSATVDEIDFSEEIVHE